MPFLRGLLLNPLPDGFVQLLPDALIRSDNSGRVTWLGAWADRPAEIRMAGADVPRCRGILCPPFLDIHLHIPQHPIRGRFTQGVPPNAPEGRLVAGLYRNVFPQERRAEDPVYAEGVIREFLADTLAQGVVGGSAYMTVHAPATRAALRLLPESWSVGLVLMDQNCPEYLRTDTANLAQDVEALAAEFGRRLVLTDRFAVSVSTPLRKQAAELAGRLGLRMQTHLNEQRSEKRLVEQVLYPEFASYTDVYRRDGLLGHAPILAHCVQMCPEEWDLLAESGAAVAHCPVSNTLLGSGVMPLEPFYERGIPYALATDVGASPSTSLLVEMAQFLLVHHGQPPATPTEALWRVTRAPAEIMRVEGDLGGFAEGKPLSYIEIESDFTPRTDSTADEVILCGLLRTSAAELAAWAEAPAMRDALARLRSSGLDADADLARVRRYVNAARNRLEGRVLRVVLRGETIFTRSSPPGDPE